MGSRKNQNADRTLIVTTWNIASINNNPFEYWITYNKNPEYQKIMERIDTFIEQPGENDIPVKEVFTESMFTELEKRMHTLGWDNVRPYWNNYKNRKIVSEFIMDRTLSKNRLGSNLSRFTDTIDIVGSEGPACRPSVISMYDGDLSTLDKWWSSWKAFMFDNPLTIRLNDGGIGSLIPYQVVAPIMKSKYPAITEEESIHSLPLQTMCGAIFDAILIHIMNTVSTFEVWHPLKLEMAEALIQNKVPRTLDLLYKTYGKSDVITLQEVSHSFVDQSKGGPLGNDFWIYTPFDMHAVKDQNSVILLNKTSFPNGRSNEITPSIYESFTENHCIPVGGGGINVLTAEDRHGVEYVVASFHGSSDGRDTIPFLNALDKTVRGRKELFQRKLVLGLDANTFEHVGSHLDVVEWGKSYSKEGWTSCWGDVPEKTNYTTYNARTYIQAQLHKACTSSEIKHKGNVNPKDFILFKKDDFSVEKTTKDNTGEAKYIDNMPFPTLQFPSDHAVVSTVLKFE